MELVAEGLLDRDLFRRRLRELDEQEQVLQKDLSACRARHERIEDLEMLKAELMIRYLHEGPELLYHWPPEQRVAFYRRIGFRAEADEDGGLAATWLFGQETLCAFGTNNQILPMQTKSTRTMTINSRVSKVGGQIMLKAGVREARLDISAQA